MTKRPEFEAGKGKELSLLDIIQTGSWTLEPPIK
jgi:hypothetical protein